MIEKTGAIARLAGEGPTGRVDVAIDYTAKGPFNSQRTRSCRVNISGPNLSENDRVRVRVTQGDEDHYVLTNGPQEMWANYENGSFTAEVPSSIFLGTITGQGHQDPGVQLWNIEVNGTQVQDPISGTGTFQTELIKAK